MASSATLIFTTFVAYLPQRSGICAHLCGVQGGKLRRAKSPAVVRAGEHNVAELRLKHVLLILILLLPASISWRSSSRFTM